MLACACALIPAVPGNVQATTIYNETITANFGSGNPATGWTADKEIALGLELGLRAKERTPVSTANINGVYSEPIGVDPNNAARANWNYEFSVQGNTSLYDFFLGIDTDPSQGVNYSTLGLVNPLTYFGDNTVVGNISQNSENIVFAGSGGLNPNINATYSYDMFAVAKGAGSSGLRVADTAITVVVGAGGASVPDTGNSLALLSLSFVGIAFGKQMMKREPAIVIAA